MLTDCAEDASVTVELGRYMSQPRAQVNLESQANLESTTSQVNFF